LLSWPAIGSDFDSSAGLGGDCGFVSTLSIAPLVSAGAGESIERVDGVDVAAASVCSLDVSGCVESIVDAASLGKSTGVSATGGSATAPVTTGDIEAGGTGTGAGDISGVCPGATGAAARKLLL